MEQQGSRRWQLGAAWVTLFLVGTDLFVVSPLLPDLIDDFHLTSQKASWIVTVFAIAYAILAPLFGMLSDRWGKKNNIVIGLIIFSLANGLTFLVQTYTGMIVSRLIAGGSAAMITASVFALTGDIAPKNKNGLYLSIATSGFLTAIWIGAPLGHVIGQATHWRVVFLVLAIGTLILSVLDGALFPTYARRTNVVSQKLPPFKPMLRDVFITTCWALAVYGVYTFLGTLFKNVAGLSDMQMNLAYTFYGVGALVGSLSGGWFSDRLGNHRVIHIGMIVLSILLIAVGLTLRIPLLLFPLLTCWALSGYLIFSAYQSLISKRYRAFSGSVMAWNQTAMYVGIMLGALIGGVVLHYFTSLILFIVCALVALVGLVWYHSRVLKGE